MLTYQEIVMGKPPEKWMELCAEAAVEKDPQRLLDLVQEITRLLDERDKTKQAQTASKTQ